VPQDNESNPRSIVPGMPLVGANLGRSWIDDVPGLKERRRDTARKFTQEKRSAAGDVEIVTYEGYEGQIEEMFERGLVDVEPEGDRLLLRAVLTGDANDNVLRLAQDSRQLLLQEVVAVGPDCQRYWESKGYSAERMLKPGDFCWVLSTVADRLATKSKVVRLLTVRCEYVAAKITLRGATSAGAK
jgi:hypothetical protein